VLSFSPVVGIGTLPPPHPQARVHSPPPLVPGGHTRLLERGWGVPVPKRGHSLVLLFLIYMYFVCRGVFSVPGLLVD
jgi:hypothetical protein